MNKNFIYKSFLVLLFIAQIAYGDTFGFVPDGGNYYEAFTENNDATVQIKVDETGGNGFNLTFRLNVDYTTNVSTTEFTNGGSGSGYFKDWNYSGVALSSDNQTVTGGYTNVGVTTSGGNVLYWTITMTSSTTDATDGIYTLTLPVYDDKLYEGGSSGTPETINFYISNVIGATTLDSDKDEFVVKITDNDKIYIVKIAS